MDQQQPGAATEHYLAAGKQDMAFKAALSAEELDRAAAILEAGQVCTLFHGTVSNGHGLDY